MSRWSAERVCVGLGCGGVSLVRLSRGRNAKVLARAAVDVPRDGNWQAAVDALARVLAESEWRESRLDCVLSHRWCRISLVPDGVKLRNRQEEERFVRMRLSRDHGELPESWAVVLADNFDGGPRMACAADSELLRGIDAAAEQAKCRVASMQPLLAAAYNARRPAIGDRHAWFVTAEPDRCCIARVDRGTWRSVRLRRLFSDPAAELAALLDQERLLTDDTALPAEVVVCAPGLPDFAFPATSPWKVSSVAAPDGRPADDRAVALALEGCA